MLLNYKFYLAILFLLFGLLAAQFNWVFSQETENSPLTSPLTSEEDTIQDNPITSPEDDDNPITSPETNNPSPTPTPSQNNSNNGGSSNFTNTFSQPQAPSCNDSKPGSAPTLYSWEVTAPNEVTLKWTKAQGPVSYYLISYGVNPNQPIFGNPNIGGENTTSYTVKGLSGGVNYYFRVRSGNRCMSGDYSNELKININSGQIKNAPQGFIRGVLSAQNTHINNSLVSPSPVPTVQPLEVKHFSILERIKNYLRNLFH